MRGPSSAASSSRPSACLRSRSDASRTAIGESVRSVPSNCVHGDCNRLSLTGLILCHSIQSIQLAVTVEFSGGTELDCGVASERVIFARQILLSLTFLGVAGVALSQTT